MTTDPAETPKILPVADGFFVRQEIDNLAWADLGEYVLAVDALERPELEGEVFVAIESTTDGKPVRFLLNTHTHYDHTALNEAFRRRWGTEVLDYRAVRSLPEGREFQGPRRRVRMLHLPGCHTEEDCIVWAPDDRVLLVGDIFGWGLIPLTVNLRPQTARLLLDSYRKLIAMGAAVVVPGHGPICTSRELERWVEYFTWLCRTAHRLCQAGATDEQVAAELAPPEDMKTWWRFLAWKHEDSVAKVVRAARRGWLEKVG